MEEELFEFKGSSGDVYKLRKLKYRERKIAQGNSTKSTLTTDAKNNKQIIQEFNQFNLQIEMAWRSIVEAPWLKPNQKCTVELLDNIKPEDSDALDQKIEELNFPRSDVVEKSDGQLGVSNQSVTQK